MTGPLDGLLVADFSRVLAGPYATMLLADLGADVVKVEGPPGGDETRSWTPPERDGVSTYYLGINRGKRSIVLDLRDEADLALARELARRADVMIENLKPGGMAKFGLDFESVRVDNPGVVYASISGFGSGRRRRRARLRPAGAGDVRADEPHRVAGRSRLPRRHLGLRRDGRQPRRDRHPGRAAAPRRDRRGPARRGQPALLGAHRAGQPQLGLGGRRRGALPDGQRAPERLPLRAVPDRGRRPDRDRGQRPAVPAALRGARHPGGGRGRAVPAQRRPHRRTATSSGRCSRSGWPRARRRSGSTCCSRPAWRAGPSTPSTTASPRPSGSASSRWSRSARATGRCRRPGTRSGSPARRSSYALPPPELDEHGAELRAWLRREAAS